MRAISISVWFVVCSIIFVIGEGCPAQVQLVLGGTSHIKDEATGKVLPTVAVGKTFQLTLRTDGVAGEVKNVRIEGIEKLQTEGSSTSKEISIVNGKVTTATRFIYDVHATTEGVFRLGPAIVEADGKTFTSKAVDLKVEKSVPGAAAASDGYLFEVTVDKKAVVLGEPILLTVSFYYKQPIVRLGFEDPTKQGFIVKSLDSDFVDRRAVIHGETYGVKEKRYVLFPLTKGEKVIDPLEVLYEIPKRRKHQRDSVFDDFFFHGFFGQQVERKTSRSQPITISVDLLPPDQKGADGIGTFTAYHVNVDKSKVTVNEPISLHVILEGSGSFEQIQVPPLSLPHSFKRYESKQFLEEDSSQSPLGGKKHFEYVLQAGEPGEWEIPPQRFRFFNTITREYQTLSSEPLKILVEPTPGGEKAPPPQASQVNPPEPTEQLSPQTDSYQEEIHFIEEEETPQNFAWLALPWWLFFVFLLLPLLWYGNVIMSLIRRVIFLVKGPKTPRDQMKKMLDELLRAGEAEKLYAFFTGILTQKGTVEPHRMNEKMIRELLEEDGWPHERLNAFMVYLERCSALGYAVPESAEMLKKELLDKAHDWLKELLEVKQKGGLQ